MGKTKYTEDGLRDTASKYTCVSEWKKDDICSWDAARKKLFYKEITRHFKPKKINASAKEIDDIQEIALRYSSSGEWFNGDRRSWDIAHYRGLLPEMGKHFISKLRHLSDEDIFRIASGFTNATDWRTIDRNSYAVASRRGILEQVTRHFIPRKGGFNPSMPAILYYLRCNITGFYKIGITNREVKDRAKTNNYTIIEETAYNSGKEAKKIEQQILKEFAQYRVKNEEWLHGGFTEFFTHDILNKDN